MRLSPFLRAELVDPALAAPDRDSVIKALAERLVTAGVLPSAEPAIAALAAREAAQSTKIAPGMALPHATLDQLTEPVMMVALADPPVPFGADEGDLVRLFFVILSPTGAEGRHIKLLARICRLARHPGFVEALEAAGSPEGVVEVIRRMDEEHA